jgi:DNA processing protein
VLYPKSNRDIYDDLSKLGCVISEFAPGTTPTPRYFPRRNRIISGMSIATVVVEATKNSGSLITARYALDQGRELFAVPGSPADKRSEGTNMLIRDGAHIVTNRYDVLNILTSRRGLQDASLAPLPSFSPISAPNEKTIDENREKVLDLLSFDPLGVDQLVQHTDLPVSIINAIIIEYELAGSVARLDGNMIVLSGTENSNHQDF